MLDSGPNAYDVGDTVDISDSTGTIAPVVSGDFSNGVGTETVQITGALAGVVIDVTDSATTTFVGSSNVFDVVPGTLFQFTFQTQPVALYIAGPGIAVRIYAEDQFGNLKTGYTQGVAVSDNTGTIAEGAPGSGDTVITFSNGVYNAGLAPNLFITDAAAGIQITVTDGAVSDSSNAFTVQPAALNYFTVEAAGGGNIGNQVADTAFNIDITAYDQYGNVLDSGPNAYDGPGDTVEISDTTGTLTQTSAAFVNGVITENVQITQAQNNVSINVVDTATTTFSGNSNSFNVGYGSLAHFLVIASPTSLTAGSGVTVTVTAHDQYHNVVTTYNNGVNNIDVTQIGAAVPATISYSGGGVNFNDNLDGTATLDFGANFTNGVWSFIVTDTTAEGPVQIAVTEQVTGYTGSTNDAESLTNVTWSAGAISYYEVSTTTPQTSGIGWTETITAKDVFGNDVTVSSDTTVNLSSSTGNITFYTDGTYTTMTTSEVITAGTSFVTIYPLGQTAETVTITVTDTNSKTGTSGLITVDPASMDHLLVIASPTSLTAGNGVTVTVTAHDQYHNVVTGYNNTNTIDVTQIGAAVPTTISYSGGGITDNGNGTASVAVGSFTGGVYTFDVTDTTAEGPIQIEVQELTTTYTGSTNDAESGTDITWVIGNLAYFMLTPSTVDLVAGNASSVTIRAYDSYDNQITTYNNANAIDITQSGGTGGAGSPISYIAGGLTDNGDGTASIAMNSFAGGEFTFDVTDTKAEGPVMFTATESILMKNGLISSGITWQPGAAIQYVVITTVSDPQTAGVGFTFRVEAHDVNNNIVTTYNEVGVSLEDVGPDLIGVSPSTVDIVIGVGEGTVNITQATDITGSTVTLRVGQTSGGLAIDDSNAFTVQHNILDHFVVTAAGGGSISQQTAGAPFAIDIEAQDAYDNRVLTFTGVDTVDLSETTGTIMVVATSTNTTQSFTNGQLLNELVTINAQQSNVMIIVTDSFGGTGTGTEKGFSNMFNVISNVMVVDIVDRAPKVALASETIEMLDIHITNVTAEDINITYLEFVIESSKNGTSIPVNPSTLIDDIYVEDLTNGGIYQPTTIGTGTVTVDMNGLPLLVSSGGIFDFRITLKIKDDISSAVILNVQLRIGDVIGVFLPSGGPVDPVNTDYKPITDPANYLRSSITQIREEEEKAAFNYPNPFNPRKESTTISFYNSGTKATVKIYTITGKLVRDLTKDTPQTSGSVEVQWDGKNSRGQVVRNGVYVAVITAGGTRMMVKIAVVK